MRRLCRFAAGFVIGCAACVWFLRGSTWSVAAIGALAAILAACFPKSRGQGVRLTLLGFAISLVFCAGYRAVLLRPIEAFCAQNQAEIQAEVLDYPTASRYGSAVLVKVKTGGVGMKAVLYYQQDAALSPGDQISARRNFARQARTISSAMNITPRAACGRCFPRRDGLR